MDRVQSRDAAKPVSVPTEASAFESLRGHLFKVQGNKKAASSKTKRDTLLAVFRNLILARLKTFVTFIPKSEVMKKVVTVAVLVAFAGAVAFASFETSRKQNNQQQQKQEKKEIKKKKQCSHTCLFS